MKTEKGHDVLMYMDSQAMPVQAKLTLTEDQYKYALRTLIEFCIEDLGFDTAGMAVAYAVFRNGLPPDLWDYCE